MNDHDYFEYYGIDTNESYDELQHFDFSKIKLPKIDLPKIDLPNIDLPKFNLPKIDLPKFDNPFDKKDKNNKNKNNKSNNKNNKKKTSASGSSKDGQGRYGREWKDHKWIDRKRDENGKWIYDYGNGFPGDRLGRAVPLEEDFAFNRELKDVKLEQNNKLSKITGLINDLGRLLISPELSDKIAAGMNFVGRLDEIKETAKAKIRQFGKRIDEKTGLPLKDENNTDTLEDDMYNVNPGWNNKDNGSQMNCPECSIAMDLRRRGYEVTAKEDIDGENANTLQNMYKGGQMIVCGADYEGQTTTEAFYETIKNEPEGSSGMMIMQWNDGGGHVVHYEIENGEPIIYDGQARERIPASEYTDLSWASGYMRTDNLEPNWDVVKEMVE